MWLPGVSLAALIVKLPRRQAFHHLKTPALFAPPMVDLHGCFTFCCQVHVLLGQMGPQLPDLKLEMVSETNGRISRLGEGESVGMDLKNG